MAGEAIALVRQERQLFMPAKGGKPRAVATTINQLLARVAALEARPAVAGGGSGARPIDDLVIDAPLTNRTEVNTPFTLPAGRTHADYTELHIEITTRRTDTLATPLPLTKTASATATYYLAGIAGDAPAPVGLYAYVVSETGTGGVIGSVAIDIDWLQLTWRTAFVDRAVNPAISTIRAYARRWS